MPHLDVLWLGSEYEGQSNAIMEAMAAGVPVVATDIAGNRDLVVPDVTGYLVPLGDRFEFTRRTHWLLDDEKLAAAAGRGGERESLAGVHGRADGAAACGAVPRIDGRGPIEKGPAVGDDRALCGHNARAQTGGGSPVMSGRQPPRLRPWVGRSGGSSDANWCVGIGLIGASGGRISTIFRAPPTAGKTARLSQGGRPFQACHAPH